MARLDRSFLVRWWVIDDGSLRIELEHIQSGARAVASSPEDALAWMSRGTTRDGDSRDQREVQWKNDASTT
jgi:hypothetical protein